MELFKDGEETRDGTRMATYYGWKILRTIDN